jgi:hypothetical protein
MLIFGWIAAQRKDVANAKGSVAEKKLLYLCFAMPDAGEVRNWRDTCGFLDAGYELMRKFASPTTSTVGDRNK